jgi:hypothetical protein
MKEVSMSSVYEASMGSVHEKAFNIARRAGDTKWDHAKRLGASLHRTPDIVSILEVVLRVAYEQPNYDRPEQMADWLLLLALVQHGRSV